LLLYLENWDAPFGFPFGFDCRTVFHCVETENPLSGMMPVSKPV
jgi:hypothetical protein